MSTAPTRRPEGSRSAVMALLASGVPISLLLDLALGPRSEDVLRRERPAAPELPEPRPA